MAATLEDYREVAPPGSVDILRRLSEQLPSRSLLQVNAGFPGGGVTEMLNRLTPLLHELGVDSQWEVIEGGRDFQATCRGFYDALQGEEIEITDAMFQEYVETNRQNAQGLSLEADVVIVHDPQPAPMVEFRPAMGKWVWRCHLDLARPQRHTWANLRKFVVQYDAAVFSLPKFAGRLPIRQFQVFPSIDPLSEKNRELTDEEIEQVLDRLAIPQDRPLLVQVSRFHRLKDPLGVLHAYRIARRQNDCRLVLAGWAEGPEGEQALAEVREAAGDDPCVHVVPLGRNDHLEINVLQRAATLVIQKSIREGFGLMVAEAMWKGKPVIGGFTGGIPAQLIYDVTGYTVNSVEGCAFRIRHLLNNPQLAEQMGRDAREFARRHFLVTRHLGDYLCLMATLLK